MLYPAIVASIRGLFRLMNWRVYVTGFHHLPAHGPAIIAANHLSYLDPLVLAWVLRKRGRCGRFLGKREVFAIPPAGWLGRRLRHIPVDRGHDHGRSVAAAEEQLALGELVCIYPEATISTSFVPLSLRSGAAHLPCATGVPIVPVAVFGPQRLATKGRPRRLRLNVPFLVAVGPPLSVGAERDPDRITALLGEQLRAMVAGLVGNYLGSTAGDWWIPAHLGGTAPTTDEAEARRERERLDRG